MSKSLLTQVIALIVVVIGYFSPVYAEVFKSTGLYALSGGLTNWLAIHMLFEKVPFLYGSGIITIKFQDFKKGIKALITQEFFNSENVSKFLGDASNNKLDDIAGILEPHIHYDDIFDKLKVAIIESPFGGMLGMFGGADALEPLRPNFKSKLKEVIEEVSQSPELKKTISEKFNSEFSLDKVHHIIDQRLDEMTPQMVKEIIQNMIKEHLGWLVVWGGFFGGLIGAVVSVVG